jgi:hypothetical protein
VLALYLFDKIVDDRIAAVVCLGNPLIRRTTACRAWQAVFIENLTSTRSWYPC